VGGYSSRPCSTRGVEILMAQTKQKRFVKCHSCDKRVVVFEETRELAARVSVNWRKKQMEPAPTRATARPTCVIGICQCGLRVRLRTVGSLADMREYFELDTKVS
jgi:hypothetical protein